jgi:hypothetical protein
MAMSFLTAGFSSIAASGKRCSRGGRDAWCEFSEEFAELFRGSFFRHRCDRRYESGSSRTLRTPASLRVRVAGFLALSIDSAISRRLV